MNTVTRNSKKINVVPLDGELDTRDADAILRQAEQESKRIKAMLAKNKVDENGECDCLWA